MVSKMVITCTGCGKKIEGPVSLQGKKIRCKVCATVFTVPAAGGKTSSAEAKGKIAEDVLDVQPVEEEKKEEAPPIALMPFDEDADGRNPYGITDHQFAPRCPHCANDMDEGDVVCLHCGYNIETRERFRTVKTIEHTAGDWILWLLPGVACVLADILLVTYFLLHHFLGPWLLLSKDEYSRWTKELADNGRMGAVSESAWYTFIFHPGIEIWIAVMFLFLGFIASRFAIRRLIFHPRPPEKFKH